jgi:hypothetical protein
MSSFGVEDITEDSFVDDMKLLLGSMGKLKNGQRIFGSMLCRHQITSGCDCNHILDSHNQSSLK